MSAALRDFAGRFRCFFGVDDVFQLAGAVFVLGSDLKQNFPGKVGFHHVRDINDLLSAFTVRSGFNPTVVHTLPRSTINHAITRGEAPEWSAGSPGGSGWRGRIVSWRAEKQ